ncbi:MAG: hypothetical protein OXI87_24135 [Albidovulum sp.]|nr:hypothetical protein [Albidovulum sp.]
MADLGILADDLTGTLDAAAPFASERAPVIAALSEADLGARFAICTCTRDEPPERAASAVARNLPLLAGARIAFKKIDSLLRGNTAIELAACARSGMFRRVIISPAFPVQGRTMRHGRLLVNGRPEPDCGTLAKKLASGMVNACSVTPADPWPDADVLLCDANSDHDLRQIVARGRALAGPVLWCGTAGLARALAMRTGQVERKRIPGLVVIGSIHAVSAGQSARLARAPGTDILEIRNPGDPVDGDLSSRFAAKRLGLVEFHLPALPSQKARCVYRAVFEKLVARIAAPSCMLIVGGDTAALLMEVLKARALSVVGSWADGIPLSRIKGGKWDCALVYTKSGAFQGCGLFERILAECSRNDK